MTARLIAEGRDREQIFVTKDGRLIVYDPGSCKHWDYGFLKEIDENEAEDILGGLLNEREYIGLMSELGMRAVVDL